MGRSQRPTNREQIYCRFTPRNGADNRAVPGYLGRPRKVFGKVAAGKGIVPWA
jgi:hypothetical protein